MASAGVSPHWLPSSGAPCQQPASRGRGQSASGSLFPPCCQSRAGSPFTSMSSLDPPPPVEEPPGGEPSKGRADGHGAQSRGRWLFRAGLGPAQNWAPLPEVLDIGKETVPAPMSLRSKQTRGRAQGLNVQTDLCPASQRMEWEGPGGHQQGCWGDHRSCSRAGLAHGRAV